MNSHKGSKLYPKLIDEPYLDKEGIFLCNKYRPKSSQIAVRSNQNGLQHQKAICLDPIVFHEQL